MAQRPTDQQNLMGCAFYTPAVPAPDSGWPLLCFLHGRGEAEPLAINEAARLHGPLRPGNPKIVTERFMVLISVHDSFREVAGGLS